MLVGNRNGAGLNRAQSVLLSADDYPGTVLSLEEVVLEHVCVP